jgi:hypothetical protein
VGAKITLERAIPRLTDPENAPCAIDQPRLAQYAARVVTSLGKIPASEIIASRPRLP